MKKIISKAGVILILLFFLIPSSRLLVSAKGIENNSNQMENQLNQNVDNIIKLLNTIKKYSEATNEEKQLLCSYYSITDESMNECEKKGYSLIQSVNLSLVVCNYGLTLSDVEKIYDLHKNSKNFNEEVKKLNMFVQRTGKENIEKIRKWLLNQYTVDQIKSAFIVSGAIDGDFDNIIRKDKEQKIENILKKYEKKYSKKDIDILVNIGKKYFVDIEKVINYMEESGSTTDDIKEQIESYDNNFSLTANALTSAETDTDSDLIEQHFNAPFILGKENGEKINSTTGSLSYERVEYKLPGKNGLDVEIVSRYDSSESNLYLSDYSINYDYDVYQSINKWIIYENDPSTADDDEWISVGEAGPYYMETCSTYSEAETAASNYSKIEQHPIADPGVIYIWEYYGSIEQYIGSLNNKRLDYTYNELHNNIGAGWSLGFSYFEKVTRDGTTTKLLHLSNGEVYQISSPLSETSSNLIGYKLKDMRFISDSSYYEDGLRSSYSLVYKDGKKEFFYTDGRLLAIKDRYGNRIKFQYKMVNTYPGKSDTYPVLYKIIDTVNREFVIVHSSPTPTQKNVIITTPTGTTIQYKLLAIQGYPNDYKLVEIIDPANRKTTFDYELKNARYSFGSKTFGTFNNIYTNLVKVSYPTGAYTQYDFCDEPVIANLGSRGVQEYYRVISRVDMDKDKSFNKQTYEYSALNYSGYPTYKNPNSLPVDFIYSTTIYSWKTDNVVSPQKVYDKLIFNNKHLLTTDELYGYNSNIIKRISYEYDTYKLPKGKKTEYYGEDIYNSNSSTQYNEYGDLLQETNEYGNTTLYTYDSKFHLLSSETKPVDAGITQKTTYIIDSVSGNIINMKQVLGTNLSYANYTYTYNSDGSMKSEKIIRNSDNVTILKNYTYGTEYSGAYLTETSVAIRKYNELKTLQTETLKETYNYDFSTGNMTSYTDRNLKTTTYEYDNLNRLIKETNHDQNSKNIIYDDIGNTVTFVNKLINGYERAIKKNTYDGLGNLIKVEEISGDGLGFVNIEERQYNSQSQLEWIMDGKKNTTSYEYDEQGRVVKETYPDISYKSTTYKINSSGEFINIEHLEGIEKDEPYYYYYYDVLGNLIGEYAGLSSAEQRTHGTTYQYNNLGEIKTKQDAMGNEMTYTYDGLGRLISVTNAKNETTFYEYDNTNNITKITTPKGTVTRKYYDEHGRLVREQNSLLQDEYYAYDGVGNITLKIDHNDEKIKFEYNNLNKLSKQTSKSKTIVYDYCPTGEVDKVTEGTEITDYTYYENGRLKKELLPDGKFIEYTYDANGNKETVIDQSGKKTKYDYDNRNRLYSVTDISSGEQTIYNYYKNGSRKNITYPGNTKEEYYYDDYNNLVSLINKDKNGLILSEFSYTYDEVGNQMTKEDKNGITIFTFDELNRVETVTDPNGLKTVYVYDGNGNVSTKTIKNNIMGIEKNIFSYTYEYDAINRVKTVATKDERVLETLNITPVNISAKADQQVAFSLSGIMTDGSSASDDILNKAVWTTSSQSVIVNTTQGKNVIVTIPLNYWNQMGSQDFITLTATINEKSVQAKVYKYALSKISVTPSDVIIFPDQRVTFSLSGIMEDGSTAEDELLNSAVWTVDSQYFTLETSQGKTITGLLSSSNWNKVNSSNTITLRATVNDKVVEAKISKVVISSLTVTPNNISLTSDEKISFTLSGIMSDGSTARDSILNTATWSSSSQYLVVDKLSGKTVQGYIPADKWTLMNPQDIITLSAVIDGKTVSVNIYKNIGLSSLTLSPSSAALSYGQSVTFTLSGKMTNGTNAPDYILNYATWKFASGFSTLKLDRTTGKQTIVYYGDGVMFYSENPNLKNVDIIQPPGGLITRYEYVIATIGNISVSAKIDIVTSGSGGIGLSSKHVENNADDTYISRTVNYDFVDAENFEETNVKVNNTYEVNRNVVSNEFNNDTNRKMSNNIISETPHGEIVSNADDYSESFEAALTEYQSIGNSVIAYDYHDDTKQNMTTITSGDGVITHQFNELNQLVSYTKNNQTISYTYYPNGLRQSQKIGDNTTKYYYDGQNVIVEEETKDSDTDYLVVARNIWGINAIARESNGSTLYYLYNGHADVVGMVDKLGDVKNLYDYDIYGNIIEEDEQSGMENPIRYAGQYYDNTSDLYYLRARYYDPGLMRFISEDTNKGDVKDPLSLNLYTYCQGNPVRYFDRDGHKKEEVNAEQEGDSISSNDTGGGTSLYSDPNYGGNPSGKLSLKTRFENWWKGIGRWKVGDDIYNPTAKGNSPSWSTVRQRFWKNEAAKPDAAKIYGAENIERMKRGLAPQRYNPDKGGMESMELSHEPVPFREGGTEFVPRWPQDHASVDPYRHPGY